MMANFFLIKWAWKIWRFVTWVYRKFAPPDSVAALVLFSVTALFSFVTLLEQVGLFANYVSVTPNSRLVLENIGDILTLLSLGFGGIYIFRLRTIGVGSVDGSAVSGLDYQSALNKVNEGFDFLGIGASKLTHQKQSFEDAIVRMSQHQAKVRILLCDPRSHAIYDLERNAGVDVGKYKLNVMQSFAFLHRLSNRFKGTLEVRIYEADTEKNLPPFRLMFINNDMCLASQVVIAAPMEGKMLPQLHIFKKSIMGVGPNFYVAYARLFDQIWEQATRVGDREYKEIANLDLSPMQVPQ